MAPSPLRRSSRKRKTVQNIKYNDDNGSEDDVADVHDGNGEEYLEGNNDDDVNRADDDNDGEGDKNSVNDNENKANGHKEGDNGGDNDGDGNGKKTKKLKTRKRRSSRNSTVVSATNTKSPKKRKTIKKSSTRSGRRSTRTSPARSPFKSRKRTKRKNDDSDNDDDESYKDISDEGDDDDEDDDDEYDSDDNEEEYEEGEVTPNSKKRKRKSISTSGQKAKAKSSSASSTTTTKKRGKKKPRDYGSLEDRTCPFCKKVFSIVTGLAYHIEHKVCQRESATQKNRKCTHMAGTFPYPKLEPGSKFITQFGIVQVISDDNIPPDHNTTCIAKDIKDKARAYNRKKDRIFKRKLNALTYNAKVQRKRRHELMNIYLKDLERKEQEQRGDGGNGQQKEDNGGGSNSDSKDEEESNVAIQIWKQYCSLTTPSLILSGKYSQNVDDKIPEQTKTVEKHPWNDLGVDPLTPEDSYPERIVECVLIKDERKRVSDLNIKTEGEGRISQIKEALKSVEKAKKAQSKKKRIKKEDSDEDDNDEIASGDDKINVKNKMSSPAGLHESGMRLYLQRKLLINSYNTKIANYFCKKCGRNFDSRVGLKGHLDELTCVKRAEKAKQERTVRLQQIEDAALSNGIKAPPPLAPPKKPTTPGDKSTKTKRKKHKKWPAWLEFYPTLSPWYPEIFESMKFKRGSNNSKFMQKKWDAIGPGRKKIRKSRAKKPPQNSVYPEVMACLFPELRSSPSPTPNKKSAPSTKRGSKTPGSKTNENNFVAHTPTPNNGYVDEIHSNNGGVDFSSLTTALLKAEAPMTYEIPLPPLPEIPLPVPNTISATSPMNVSTKGENGPVDTSKEEVNVEFVSPKLGEDTISSGQNLLPKKRRRRKRAPVANPKPAVPVLIDIQPLVEEVRGGRYPSMKQYTGYRSDICFLCKNKGGYHCEFCENSEHLTCVQSKVNIRDLEPDDTFMCHRCIQTVMARRARAEKRRLQKLDEATGNGGMSEETKAAAAAIKREIVWNKSDFDAHVVSYAKCPSGGPGGLICCESCTAAYSRQLSETSKEMDSQTVSSIGREVSELIQLLNDAKTRLQQSVDVSNANDIRMRLLNKDQVSFDHHKTTDNSTTNNGIVGFMDVFGK